MADDTHMGVHKLMEEIWVGGKCGNMPMVFSTDNVGKDRCNVADSFRTIGKLRDALGLSCAPMSGGDVIVSQDVWHARERVVREMKRSHPDYFRALAQLKRVFAR